MLKIDNFLCIVLLLLMPARLWRDTDNMTHSPSVRHTLWIFERLRGDAPPLVPIEISADLDQALEQIRSNFDLTLEELEGTFIVFGKKLWPYRKAFEEFLDVSEARLGEKFLLSEFARGLKQRYEEFKAHGGGLRDLHTGSPASFFTVPERNELCGALVEMNHEIRKYTAQAVLTTERRRYEQRIVEFQIILDDIEKRLDTLRRMADDEQEHPELASEIRAQIRAFEYGLCLLGPEHRYEAVCLAEEHFAGRREEKKMRMH